MTLIKTTKMGIRLFVLYDASHKIFSVSRRGVLVRLGRVGKVEQRPWRGIPTHVMSILCRMLPAA